MQALAAVTDDPTTRLAIAVRPGVTMPDWSAVTSGIVREALAAVFETCDWRARWAGFDEAQDRTRRAILDSYPRIGHAPTIGDLVEATGLAPDRLRDLIAGLAARDMVVLDADDATMIGAYPFIDRQTGHHLRLGEIQLNAMCAIDALGAGAMLGADTIIASACRDCGAPIRIETRQRGTALADHAPPGAVVWAGIRYADGCAAESLCTVMAFFCSEAHLESWRAGQDPAPRGFRLSPEEGLQMGKAIFMPLLAAASPNP